MRTTIDAAGRLVVPKSLRQRLGLNPGEVELSVDGAALRVEAVSDDALDDERGFLVIPASGATITDDDVDELTHADQR